MSKKSQISWLLFGLITLIAIGARFYEIKNYPPGPSLEVAGIVNEVEQIRDGSKAATPYGLFISAITSRNNFNYWQVQAASAAFGVLAVVAAFCLSKLWFGNLAGLYAALILATNYWHIALSRSGQIPVEVLASILAAIAIGLVLAWLTHQAQKKIKNKNILGVIYGIIAGLILLQTVYSATAYFVIDKNNSDNFAAHNADLVAVAEYISSLENSSFAVVVINEARVPALQALTKNDEWQYILPDRSHLLPLEPENIIVFSKDGLALAELFVRQQPPVVTLHTQRDKFYQEVVRVYKLDGVVEGIQDSTDEPVHSGLDA